MVETTNQLVYMFAIIIDYPFYQIQRKNKKCEDHNLTSSSPWLLSLSWSDRSCASVSWPSRPAPTFHAFQSSTHRVKETMGIDGNILFIEMETIWNNNLKCLLRSTSSPICLGWYVLSNQSCRSILGQCRNPEIQKSGAPLKESPGWISSFLLLHPPRTKLDHLDLLKLFLNPRKPEETVIHLLLICFYDYWWLLAQINDTNRKLLLTYLTLFMTRLYAQTLKKPSKRVPHGSPFCHDIACDLQIFSSDPPTTFAAPWLEPRGPWAGESNDFQCNFAVFAVCYSYIFCLLVFRHPSEKWWNEWKSVGMMIPFPMYGKS